MKTKEVTIKVHYTEYDNVFKVESLPEGFVINTIRSRSDKNIRAFECLYVSGDGTVTYLPGGNIFEDFDIIPEKEQKEPITFEDLEPKFTFDQVKQLLIDVIEKLK